MNISKAEYEFLMQIERGEKPELEGELCCGLFNKNLLIHSSDKARMNGKKANENKLLVSIDGKAAIEQYQMQNKLNDDVYNISDEVRRLNKRIWEINQEVSELRAELDAAREQADSEEKKNKRLSFLLSLLGGLISGCLPFALTKIFELW